MVEIGIIKRNSEEGPWGAETQPSEEEDLLCWDWFFCKRWETAVWIQLLLWGETAAAILKQHCQGDAHRKL